MKPLLRPTGRPHPSILQNALGLTGECAVTDLLDYKTQVDRILQQLKALSSARTVSLEEQLEQGHASLRTYVFPVGDANTGNAQFNYTGKSEFTMRIALFWSFLPQSPDQVVPAIDALWSSTRCHTLYAYDSDDYSLQNCTMVLGMEHWGLVREQLDLVNPYGIVDEIDTRSNPGFFLNHDGLYWSVQWLNYWSASAQERLFRAPPGDFPPGVQVKDLGQGAVRVRLSERPGRFDDVEFHKRQLECRRRLPFAEPFRLPKD